MSSEAHSDDANTCASQADAGGSRGGNDPRDSSEWFVEFSHARFQVPVDDLRTVVAEAESHGVAPHEHALRTGVIDVVQADVISTLIAGRDILPDYDFRDMIGKGAMGVVYRARQMSLDRIVAIKTILLGQARESGLIARFEQEAKTIARLRHPNIVSAFDFHSQSGRLYLVLEFLEGDTLDDWLKRRGRLDEATAWHLIRQAAAGLAHAVDENVVHRDIKPGNLFVVDPPAGFPLPAGIPMLKITDFGLALLASDDEDATRLTGDGFSLGTPAFMAPEQFGSSDVDHRADIYALGITAFEMLHGSTPFSGRSIVALMADKVNQPAPRLNELHETISAESSQLVAEMLAVNPDERPSDYHELLRRIDAILASASTVVPPPSTHVENGLVNNEGDGTAHMVEAETVLDVAIAPDETVTRRGVRRNLWTIGVLIVVGLVAVAAHFAGLFQNSESTGTATAMEQTGRIESLFDADSIAGWQAQGGRITQGLDAELADVLRVNGTVRRALPDFEFYRIAMGLDLHTADEVQFHFDFQPDVGRRLVLHISRTQAVLGRLVGNGTVEPISQPVVFPSDPWPSRDEPVYREVRIDREPGRWGVSFNGESLGDLPKPVPGKPSQLGIIVPDNEITMEGLFVEELRPQAESINTDSD